MIINEYLLNLCNYRQFLYYLIKNDVKLVGFNKFTIQETGSLCNHIDNYIKNNNVEVKHFPGSNFDKNELARNDFEKCPDKVGLISDFSVV